MDFARSPNVSKMPSSPFPIEFIAIPIFLGSLLTCAVCCICTMYHSNRIRESSYVVMYYQMRNNPPPIFVQPMERVSSPPPLRKPPPILIVNPDESVILGEKK